MQHPDTWKLIAPWKNRSGWYGLALLFLAASTMTGCVVSTANLSHGTHTIRAEGVLNQGPGAGPVRAQVQLWHQGQKAYFGRGETLSVNGTELKERTSSYGGPLEAALLRSDRYTFTLTTTASGTQQYLTGSIPV